MFLPNTEFKEIFKNYYYVSLSVIIFRFNRHVYGKFGPVPVFPRD